jgi:IrrE N-terminal-like domain
MTPEEYLAQLVYSSRFGPLVVSQHSEIRKATNLFAKGIVSELFGVPVDLGGPAVTGFDGSDPTLTAIRDQLLPFFPANCRERVSDVPIGTVNNLDFDAFAAPAPDGGAVVGVDIGLKTLLTLNNHCVHLFDPGDVQRNNRMITVFAYGAAKLAHMILAWSGKASPPSLPKPQRDPRMILIQATEVSQGQLRFVVAHEFAHICLGHLNEGAAGRRPVQKAQELEADETAAKVLLAQERARPEPRNPQDLALALGAIGAIFWVHEAVAAVTSMGAPVSHPYPHPEDRFDQVIESFRGHYGTDLMGAEQYMRPLALVSEVFRKIGGDPLEATRWLCEIALACREVGDSPEELFILSIARETAAVAGDIRLRNEIAKYVEQGVSEVSRDEAESILRFRL